MMRLRASIIFLGTLPVLVAVAALALVSGFSLTDPGVLGAIFLGLVTGLVLSVRVLRSLLRPIVRLRRVARRLKSTEGVDAAGIADNTEDLAQLAATFTAVANDVRRALREAQERHEETEAIFLRMADGILVVDGDLRIHRLNPAAADLLALPADRAAGRTVIEASMHHALDELFREAIATGTTKARRLETIQPRRRVLQALVTPLGNSVSGGGAVAVLQDLTELDRLERVRRDFVTNVSHELRTPVTSIKVMVESLQRGALQQPEVRDEFLQAINEAANRLARLVDDVLALARVEAGPGRLEWHEVDLRELIEEVAAAQQPVAREYGIALDIGPLDEGTVSGDAEGLRQAAANLIGNGIKYNVRGGQVRVALARKPEGMVLTVADTGIGIPAAHHGRIFERFYRVDRGRSRELGGTGLGLAIVKHVAEAHGGHVGVESELGKGTTFTLVLPTHQGKDVATRTDTHMPGEAGGVV